MKPNFTKGRHNDCRACWGIVSVRTHNEREVFTRMKGNTCLIIMALAFFLNACSTHSKNPEDAPIQDPVTRKQSKKELREENQRLHARNERIISNAKKIVAKIKTLTAENDALRAQNDLLRVKVDTLEAELVAVQVTSGAEKTENTSLSRAGPSIKVLASNGDINTARATAQRLNSHGYSVRRTDLTEEQYSGTTVFFAEGFESHGKEIASELGGEEIDVRELSWPSAFDIIIVTDRMR